MDLISAGGTAAPRRPLAEERTSGGETTVVSLEETVWLNSRESGSETIRRTTRKTVCPEPDFSVPRDATLPAALPLAPIPSSFPDISIWNSACAFPAGRMTRWLHYCTSAFGYYVMCAGLGFQACRRRKTKTVVIQKIENSRRGYLHRD